jgi:hypothetical protein
VKQKSGATRIVGAKAKCRRGEKKLSWNTAGSRGPAGAPGSPGAGGADGRAGANGAASAYSVVEPGSVLVPTSKETTVLAKTLPPGSYVLVAKTNATSEAEKPGWVDVLCALLYRPGTSVSGEATTIDLSGWETALAQLGPTEFRAGGTVAMQGTLTSKVTNTVAMICVSLTAGLPPPVHATYSQLQAFGVTSIG